MTALRHDWAIFVLHASASPDFVICGARARKFALQIKMAIPALLLAGRVALMRILVLVGVVVERVVVGLVGVEFAHREMVNSVGFAGVIAVVNAVMIAVVIAVMIAVMIAAVIEVVIAVVIDVVISP